MSGAKILMIHGYTQNAEIFSSRTSNLRRKALKLGGVKTEFFFAESPLACHAVLSPGGDAEKSMYT